MNQCKSILVVEDNEDVRDAVVDVLAAEGFSVRGAADGKEALSLLPSLESPALILLDLMMPVMSGWEFLDAKKRDARLAGHRVVTISAVEASLSIDDPTPLKVNGVIQKPLSLEKIWNEVKKHCALPVTVA